MKTLEDMGMETVKGEFLIDAQPAIGREKSLNEILESNHEDSWDEFYRRGSSKSLRYHLEVRSPSDVTDRQYYRDLARAIILDARIKDYHPEYDLVFEGSYSDLKKLRDEADALRIELREQTLNHARISDALPGMLRILLKKINQRKGYEPNSFDYSELCSGLSYQEWHREDHRIVKPDIFETPTVSEPFPTNWRNFSDNEFNSWMNYWLGGK